MDKDTILDILGSGSPELDVLKENLEQLTGFLKLVETVDKLPGMDRRVSEDGLSLYHAISKEKEMAALEAALGIFFGEPVKRAGEPLPSNLNDNLTISYLGGVKQDQVLFLKKIGQGEMYGALFPWQRKINVITVHLGLYNPVMPDNDYGRLEKLVTETITQRVSEEVECCLAGQVRGISLPSFLQMSEMESSTCSLRISSGDNTGTLHLLNGSLIDAETGDLKHREAAYAILGWDNPGIEILKAVGRTRNEIKLPLMHLLMDSMRRKDQREFEKDAPPDKAKEETPRKDKTESPEGEKEFATEAPKEITPQKIERKAPQPPPSGPKKPEPTPEPQKKGVASPAESPDMAIGIPIEEIPPEPQKKAPEADAAIDESLIQADAPLEAKHRKADKTAAASKTQKKFPMALAAGIGVLVLCAAGFFLFQGIKGKSVLSDYQQLINKVDQLKDADAQEKLLMDFINSHEPGEDTAHAEMRLREMWVKNEEAHYQKTIDAVNAMPIDQAFEKNARTLYTRFLEKYPDTPHADDIRKAISEISGLSEDIVFSNLKNLGEKDYIHKIHSYENYLSLYPKGKYVESVKQMFSGTLGESYNNFKREVGACERDGKWDTCLAMCDDYLAVFSAYLDTGEIQSIRNRIRMEKDYLVLKDRVAGLDDNGARELYTAYMTSYPDSPNNKEIQKEIQRMDLDAAAGHRWAALKKSLQDSGLDLQTKIDGIETYLSGNNKSPYAAEAREILKTLEKEAAARSAKHEQSLKSSNEEEKAKKEAEEDYAAVIKRQAESTRIEGEKKKAIAALAETGGRFVVMGEASVMDNKTGLMWSLLDSKRELGACMDYRTAKRYVKELRHNGYDDWRLPTSAELAGIYKNKPYFPDSGAEWYWTSEIFAKGYSYIVNTVSAKQETVFKKISQDVEACGDVRAVRP